MIKVFGGFFYALLGILALDGWCQVATLYKEHSNFDTEWIRESLLSTLFVYVVCGAIFVRALLKKPTAP